MYSCDDPIKKKSLLSYCCNAVEYLHTTKFSMATILTLTLLTIRIERLNFYRYCLIYFFKQRTKAKKTLNVVRLVISYGTSTDQDFDRIEFRSESKSDKSEGKDF